MALLGRLLDKYLVPKDVPERWKWRPTTAMLHPLLYNSEGGVFEDDSPFAQAIEQPVPGVFHFPLFSDEYCEFLIDMTEERNRWGFNRKDDYAAWEQPLHKFPFVWNYHVAFVMERVVGPVCGAAYGWQPEKMQNAFFIKYAKPICEDMKPHHDHHSLVSMSVNLNDDFEGGALEFTRYPGIQVKGRKGWGVMFAGSPTMPHQALPIESGNRYVLVYWMK